MWAKLKVPPRSKPPSLFQYTITLVTLFELIKVTSKCFHNIPNSFPLIKRKKKKNHYKGFHHSFIKLGIKVERRVCRRNYSFKVESKAIYFGSTLFWECYMAWKFKMIFFFFFHFAHDTLWEEKRVGESSNYCMKEIFL